MPKLLTPAQIEQFREEGYLAPIRVMPAAEALEYRRRLEAFEATTGGPLAGDLRHKSHLLFTWLNDLIRHSRILDAVEDLYGHFAPKPRPSVDLDPAMLPLHRDIAERNARILYRGTGVASFNDPRGVGLR